MLQLPPPPRFLRRRSASLLALAWVLTACGRADEPAAGDGDVGGTLVVSTVAEAEVLVPLLARSTNTKQVTDQVFDALAEIGPDFNTVGDAGWTPRLARSWEWSADSLAITFHLDPRARWHDGRPVTARDVQFSLELYKDPKVLAYDASNFENVDSISVPDSLTAVAWFHERSLEQFFRIAYYLWVMPEHQLRDADRSRLAESAFARNPVGSGPFRFARWAPREALELVADTAHYRGRPKLDRIIFLLQTEAATGLTSVLASEADFREMIPPELLSRVAESDDVRAVRYPMLNNGFLAFNLRAPGDDARAHPLFQSRVLRRALAMALDRPAMVRNALDSTGAVSLGPFTSGIPDADTALAQIPYDTAGARQLLDSLGWRDRDGDGVRERNGTVLRFGLLVPTTSVPRRRLAVLIQEQLRRVGAAVDVQEQDPAGMQALLPAGKFDTYIHFVQASPSASSIRDNWTRPRPARRVANPAQYGNATVDALVDSALATIDGEQRRTLLHRAYRMIADDVPAVWLYEATPYAALNKRVRPVLGRADTWWRDLRLWWIPSNERNARDRAGAGLTAR